jgi:hypothetical protein
MPKLIAQPNEILLKVSFGSHNLKLITKVEFCNFFLVLDDFDIA